MEEKGDSFGKEFWLGNVLNLLKCSVPAVILAWWENCHFCEKHYSLSAPWMQDSSRQKKQTNKKKDNFLLALNSWTPQWWDPHSFYLRSEGKGYRMLAIDKDTYWCLHRHHGYRVAMEPRARMRHLRFGSSAGINEKKNVQIWRLGACRISVLKNNDHKAAASSDVINHAA